MNTGVMPFDHELWSNNQNDLEVFTEKWGTVYSLKRHITPYEEIRFIGYIICSLSKNERENLIGDDFLLQEWDVNGKNNNFLKRIDLQPLRLIMKWKNK